MDIMDLAESGKLLFEPLWEEGLRRMDQKTWEQFRNRPQRRYSLASRIIREIIHGSYPASSYLPSLPQMVDRYGVGMNTIRRALDILEDLGMTRSYHGKGTIVCPEPEKIEAPGRKIREGIEPCPCLRMLSKNKGAASLGLSLFPSSYEGEKPSFCLCRMYGAGDGISEKRAAGGVCRQLAQDCGDGGKPVPGLYL